MNTNGLQVDFGGINRNSRETIENSEEFREKL